MTLRSALEARPLLRFYLVVVLMFVTTITGMATGFGLFYRVLYVLLGTTILSYVWTWLSVASLEVAVDRHTPKARVGENLDEEITARNLSRLPKPSLEVDDLTDLPGAQNARAVHLGSLGSATWPTETLARKRGIYTMGPVRVSHTDPFALFRRERRFGGTAKVMVYPRVFDLPEFYVPSSDITGETSMMRRTHNVTPQASSVRDYAFGDSLSRIHWGTTARMGKLMSKEFDLGRAGEVWVLVDLQQEVQAGELEDSTDEYAASIAASLAKRYIQAVLPLGLLAYGDRRHFLPAETGAGQFERIMDSLAVSKAVGVMSLDGILAREEPLWSHRSSLIAITSSPRFEWAIALGEVAKRGVRAAAVLLDSRSFGAPFDSLDVVEHLAAAGVTTYVVGKGDDIPGRLSRPQVGRGPGSVDQQREVSVAV